MNARPITAEDLPALAAFLADDETHLFGRPSRVGVADVTAWLSGVDLSLIRANMRVTPTERARRAALRVQKIGRIGRTKPA